jgi:ketoreductase RED1
MARLTIESDVEHAVADADVVQENGPENLPLKRELFGRIEQAAPADALLLSSTSGLLPDDIGGPLATPGRVLVGHPFNPPHVLPLVEVVPGRHTAPDTVTAAVEFYRSVGKTPVVLHKAVPGFVANRLQAAMFRECVHLVQQGVVDIEELDAVVTGSLGPRWAAVGPFLAFHLGGGRGGLRRFLTHLGPGMERSWRGLGQPHLDEETVRYLAEEADQAYGTAYDELTERRDTKQNAVLSALAQNSAEPC